MSLLSWNSRGLGNFQIVKVLEKVVQQEEPNMVFLMETKLDLDWMVKVQDRCKFKHGLMIPSRGKSGGLALYWKEGIKVDVQTYFPTHIDALVDGGAKIGWWHLIGFYDDPNTVKRPESWAKLRYLRGTSSLLWLVIGYFNELIGLSKKEGGSLRPRHQMENFVDTINWCGLRDIWFVGPKFTWIY